MKARHIVMIITLILFATIMFSLKEEKDTKHMVCKAKNDFQGLDSIITLDIGINNSEIKDLDITIDAKVPEIYKDQKQSIINSTNQGGKMQASSTKDGIRFKTDIHSEYFKSLGLKTKTNSKELKEALEMQGYKCE